MISVIVELWGGIWEVMVVRTKNFLFSLRYEEFVCLDDI